MGYLPAIIVGVAGLLVVVALVAVLFGHLRRTTRAAEVLRTSVAAATESLRAAAGSARERRADRG